MSVMNESAMMLKEGNDPHRVQRWKVAMQSCMSGGGTHTDSWPNLEGESGTRGN